MIGDNTSIRFVQHQSRLRAARWHGGNGVLDWSGLEWAGAMCGEAGEAANVAKKLRRLEQQLDGNKQSERPGEFHDLVDHLARECADTFLYLVLLAERYGIDLESAVKLAFNQKSQALGFPERL